MIIPRLLVSIDRLESAAAARKYADAGVPVFPCVAGGKRPLTAHGFHDASADPARVTRWWARWPNANIGMPTGSVSGVEVVDVDVHGVIRGFTAFERARAEGLIDRWAALVRTPSGGVHAYYPAHPELVQPSWQVPSAGVDFRGTGGYVVVPPSVVTEGESPYALVATGKREPAPVDARALRDFLEPHRMWAPALVRGIGLRTGIDVERIARWIATRDEGERNRGLFWASCRLAESGFAPESIGAVLGPAAERAGLPAPEVAATIRSAYRTASTSAASPSPRVDEPRLAPGPPTRQVLS